MLPNYKEIVDLLKKGATVEAQEKIMELREAVIELQDDNAELRAKVRELEEELKIQGGIRYETNIYYLYREDEAGDLTIRDGPYCQRCYDSDKKLIRLQNYGDVWLCADCRQSYEK